MTAGGKMAKFLIIDDDVELANCLAGWLRSELHQVHTEKTGCAGFQRALSEHFDALILDIGLPDMDGFTVCKQFREEGGQTAILMLTGQTHINDRITGLELGADDYLTKPFSARELSARLRAILRRPQGLQSDTLSNGSINLDLKARKVLKNGQSVSLLPTDFALLEFLMNHSCEVFSSEDLLHNIWSADKHPTDNAVRSSIKRLRKALDDDENNSIIETVNRVGYRLRQTSENRKMAET